jgi:L-alanine-DL-glutamate epimerase-like enolase superfamily enzyme
VSPVRVTARRPAEVAREVERLASAGRRAFVLKRVDHGGMLDMERLGAARYAAGHHSDVGLEEETPTAVAAAR